MSSAAGTIEQLAGELARIFEPLAARIINNSAGSILELLGLRTPDTSAGAQLSNALTATVTAAATITDLVEELAKAIATEDASEIAKTAASLIEEIIRTVQAATSVADALHALGAGGPGLTAAQRAELTAFAGEFVQRLLQHLLVEYFESRAPQVAIALIAAGAIEIEDVAGGPAGSLQGAYTRKSFHIDRAAKLFTDPVGLLRDTYNWGAPGFDGLALFNVVQGLLERQFEQTAEILHPPGLPAALEAFGFRLAADTTQSPPGLEAELRFPISLAETGTASAGDWDVTYGTSASLGADLHATLHPPFDVEFDLPSGSVDVALSAGLDRKSSAPPLFLFGTAGSSRLEVQSPGASVALTAHFDTTAKRLTLSPSVQIRLRGGKLFISGEGGDSFISTLLSGINIESNFDTQLTWSPQNGISFTGSAALEIAIPTHVTLGPLDISRLYLRVTFAADGSIPIELSAAFGAALGPLQASVDRLGVTATLRFPQGGGNLGPADLSFAFKPPNGVGLSIDAGVVTGGGFLLIDTDRGEYAGALELALFDVVTIKAIGIINTRMPDGSNGFSLLIIMSVEFGAGIQLGFGFTLLAVGGLLGLNRTMKLQALADGVRSGAVQSVMFPRDIIANAPKIISDLSTFFPPRNGIFLIGPMAKLGWGTPTLVSLALGIIIEIPGNIAIVGILQVALPAADAPLINLQVNFIGAIEFDKKRLWFFAALFDSRVLFLTIEGEMGLLVAFGDDANFVVSVGGFHPRFAPPPLPFPSPRRIAISLLNTSVARIRVEGYFAVTSNTVQFGASVEVFFGLDAINVQGHLAFDALFQFSPFYFIIEISASLSVKVFGIGLFSVSLRGSLEGPAPWHIEGHGSISLLFFDIGVDFSTTWGEDKKQELPPIAVLSLIQTELNKADNWRAFLPQSASLLVSLRKMEQAEAALILHPVGLLRISQRAVPLDLKLDKIGSRKPSDVNRISLAATGGGLTKKADATEQFAPAQYQNFSDADKLSEPAFAPEHSGLDLTSGGDDLRSSKMVRRVVRYEEIIIDSNFKRFARRFTSYFGVLFQFFLNGAAVAKSPVSKANQVKLVPFTDKIEVQPDTYAVAFQSNNKAFSADTVAFQSRASARDFLDRQIALNPNLADELHVIPSVERAA